MFYDLLGLENPIFSGKRVHNSVSNNMGLLLKSIYLMKLWGQTCESVWMQEEQNVKRNADGYPCNLCLLALHQPPLYDMDLCWGGHLHPKVLLDLISLHQYSAMVWPMCSQRHSSFLLMGICGIVRLWLAQEIGDGEDFFFVVWLVFA